MNRLQKLAGINELEINKPGFINPDAEYLCNLSIGVEFCNDDGDLIQKYDIPNDDTGYFDVSEFDFPIRSLNHLKYQILEKRKKMISLLKVLNELEINKPNNLQIPKGWVEQKLDSSDKEPDEDGYVTLRIFTAPMEGWDYEHEDMVFILTKNKKYKVDTYISFGGYEESEMLYNSFNEALEKARNMMEELKLDWVEDEGFDGEDDED